MAPSHMAFGCPLWSTRSDAPSSATGSTGGHRQAVPDLALLLSIVHQDFLSRETLTVNNLRQFQSRNPALAADVLKREGWQVTSPDD